MGLNQIGDPPILAPMRDILVFIYSAARTPPQQWKLCAKLKTSATGYGV